MMAYAENVAGMAFSNAGLGMVHAMAHALGGHYNLPHGVCNAVLLPYVLEFNGRSAEVRRRFVKIARALHLPESVCGCEQASFKASVEVIRQISKLVGIPGTLGELETVNPSDFEALSKLAVKDTCMGDNQITATVPEVMEVYARAYRGN